VDSAELVDAADELLLLDEDELLDAEDVLDDDPPPEDTVPPEPPPQAARITRPSPSPAVMIFFLMDMLNSRRLPNYPRPPCPGITMDCETIHVQ